MNKKVWQLSLAGLLTAGMAGCGNNDEAAVQDRYSDRTQPIGYYSNEDHRKGGNAQVLDDDNDGPIIEILDHSFGAEARETRSRQAQILQSRDENGNPPNPSTPLADHDRNFFAKDNRFSRSDANYHGHLDDNTSRPRTSYYRAYEGELSEKISNVAAAVDNVEDVRSVSYGSDVLIAVDLTDYSREEKTKQDICNAVKPYVRGRSCTVVTDEGTFSRIRNLDNDMRDGGPREQIDMDLRNLFRSLRD